MDDIQFEKAEYSNPAGVGPCAMCGARILATYWQVNGTAVCPNCGGTVSAAVATPSDPMLLHGALYAVGAALACAVGYAAILTVTNYELAIVSIAVGWLVGQAARKGTNGQGGRPLQIIAVAATYVAICSSVFLQSLWILHNTDRVISDLRGYFVVFLISMGKPFLELKDGLGGILGIAILIFGLMQAWKQTGNAKLTLTGPFSTERAEKTEKA